MTDFIKHAEETFKQAKKDFKEMTEQQKQITERMVIEYTGCDTDVSQLLILVTQILNKEISAEELRSLVEETWQEYRDEQNNEVTNDELDKEGVHLCKLFLHTKGTKNDYKNYGEVLLTSGDYGRKAGFGDVHEGVPVFEAIQSSCGNFFVAKPINSPHHESVPIELGLTWSTGILCSNKLDDDVHTVISDADIKTLFNRAKE